MEKFERVSLKFTSENLEQYDKSFIAPKHLECDYKFQSLVSKYNIEVRYFDDRFFENIDGYNRLMLNLDFYSSFSNFDYILICQLDVLVLSDDLEFWISKGYDYIGAPWITCGIRPNLDSMGNGGLSLRKVSKFIKVLESKSFYYSDSKFNSTSMRVGIKNIIIIKILKFFQSLGFSIKFVDFFLFLYKRNEDYFWSFLSKYFVDEFILADANDALLFSFEKEPKECFIKSKSILPFGVHAWQKYDIDFWIEHVPNLQYELEENPTNRS